MAAFDRRELGRGAAILNHGSACIIIEAMEWLAVHGFVIALWSTVFWASIHLFDRGNAKNTFGLAVVLGVVCDLSHVFGIPDVFYLVAWLVFLLRLVMWHYGLGLLGAAVVTASTVLGPYFLLPEIAKFVGDSELRDDLVIYGFPLAVFGTWIATAVRKRMQAGPPAPAPGDDSTLPPARVARGGRKRAAQPPIAVVPPVVAAPAVAAAAPEPVTPRSDGGPTFLT